MDMLSKIKNKGFKGSIILPIIIAFLPKGGKDVF
jgi:hypothetical protein